MKLLLFAVAIVLSFNIALSQDLHLSSQKKESSFGIGGGLPYGGFGVRFGTNVANSLNLFGGLGYQLAGVGYNIGLLKDFKSSSMAQFYLTGMYGTNAAIKVKGLEDEYNDVYAGPSFGLGVKINSIQKEGNYWDLGILIPVRSGAFQDDYDKLKNDNRITDLTDPWPVLFVIGYNFNL